MNTYYEIEGYIGDEREVLFGSFVKQECKEELEECKQGWKWDGYKKVKITNRSTTEKPCDSVYENLADELTLKAFILELKD